MSAKPKRQTRIKWTKDEWGKVIDHSFLVLNHDFPHLVRMSLTEFLSWGQHAIPEHRRRKTPVYSVPKSAEDLMLDKGIVVETRKSPSGKRIRRYVVIDRTFSVTPPDLKSDAGQPWTTFPPLSGIPVQPAQQPVAVVTLSDLTDIYVVLCEIRDLLKTADPKVVEACQPLAVALASPGYGEPEPVTVKPDVSFCQCGCGTILDNPKRSFVGGHNMRTEHWKKPKLPKILVVACSRGSKPSCKGNSMVRPKSSTTGIRTIALALRCQSATMWC